MKKTLINFLIAALLAGGLAGCTKKSAEDPNVSQSEGDIEIIIPEDQEFGGE